MASEATAWAATGAAPNRVPQLVAASVRERFDAAATSVRPFLVARVRRAGASAADAEDAAQEALLRAWASGLEFADNGDLLRWCTTVARNAQVDEWRQRSRCAPLDALDGECANARRDFEAVELRHLLATVDAAMDELTPHERASLTAAVGNGRAEQVRLAVTRHRARNRLRALVGPAS